MYAGEIPIRRCTVRDGRHYRDLDAWYHGASNGDEFDAEASAAIWLKVAWARENAIKTRKYHGTAAPRKRRLLPATDADHDMVWELQALAPEAITAWEWHFIGDMLACLHEPSPVITRPQRDRLVELYNQHCVCNELPLSH